MPKPAWGAGAGVGAGDLGGSGRGFGEGFSSFSMGCCTGAGGGVGAAGSAASFSGCGSSFRVASASVVSGCVFVGDVWGGFAFSGLWALEMWCGGSVWGERPGRGGNSTVLG